MTNFLMFITSKKYPAKSDHSGLIFSDLGMVTKTKEYQFNVSRRTSNLS